MDRLSSSGSLSRFAYHTLQNNQVRDAPFLTLPRYSCFVLDRLGSIQSNKDERFL